MHPLDQLSSEEITRAADLVRKSVGSNDRMRFVCISLAEPTKAELAAFDSGAGAPLRAAECVLLLPDSGETREMTVDLTAGQVQNSKTLPAGTIALFSPDDCFLAERIVKEDAGVRGLLKDRYGITDMDEVLATPSRTSAAWKKFFRSTNKHPNNSRGCSEHQKPSLAFTVLATISRWRATPGP